MRAALVLEVSGTEVAAVIAGEHDQRLVELASSIEVVDEAAEVGIDDYFRRRAQRVVALMRAGLERAVEQGLVRSDLDLDLAARHCQAMMYGLQVQWLFDPGTDMVTSFQGFLDGVCQVTVSVRSGLSP
jgi:hypothetical protein